MLDKKLKEAMDLLGGRVIIKDQDQIFILLSFKEFKKIKKEGLEGLTKQQLVDKINNDIASWKVIQEEQQVEEMDLVDIGEIKSEEIRYEKSVE